MWHHVAMPDDHHPLIWSLTAVASVLAIVFTRHAMSAITDRNPIVLAALACCIPLMACLNAASASEHRSRAVTREFQREHPCPSTDRTSGACPGYRKDHIVPLACGGPDAVSNLQWQTIPDARAKDAWERRACAR